MKKSYYYESDHKRGRKKFNCYNCRKALEYNDVNIVPVAGVGMVPYCSDCKRLFIDGKRTVRLL